MANILKLRDEFFKDVYSVDEKGVYEFKTYVTGKWVSAKKKRDVRSPIDSSIIARIPRLEWNTIDEGLRTLYEKGRWVIRDTPGEKRLNILYKIADLMEEHKEDLVNALVINAGKTRKQALGEVNASIERLRKAELDVRKIFGEYIPGDWTAHTLESEAVVRREPYGVVLNIIPFNYPLFDTVNKFTYSSIVGNAVAVKPPSADPLPILLFAKIVEEAGFPAEAFAVFTIPGSESDRLVSDNRIHVINLTGSSKTGKRVLSVAGIKQFVMELGGGDPAIVLEDADPDETAEKIVTGMTSYSGQRCDAIKLILVEEKLYEDLKKRIVEKLSKIVVGDPRNEETIMGPLIDEETVDDMLKAVREAEKLGARILYGGKRLGPTYVEPTLVEVYDKSILPELRLYREEIFAPVAIITWFKDLDEAIKIANNRPYGLDAAVFGYNIAKIRKLVRYLDVGAIYINEYPRHGVGYYPFGGRKESGIGREGIGYSVEYVTAWKTIVYSYKGKGVWPYT